MKTDLTIIASLNKNNIPYIVHNNTIIIGNTYNLSEAPELIKKEGIKQINTLFDILNDDDFYNAIDFIKTIKTKLNNIIDYGPINIDEISQFIAFLSKNKEIFDVLSEDIIGVLINIKTSLDKMKSLKPDTA